MRSMWKGAISFGLVNVPVKLFTATENRDIRFNYLHKDCKTPIKYSKVCPTCNREIHQEELVRGYEYEKGRYVVIDDEDLASIPTETTKTVDILDFVDLSEIDPIYFEKSYYLAPNDGGQKAYELLKRAMEETGKIAIAKVVIRTKESLAAIRVRDNALVMETMFYPEEVRSTDALTELNYNVKVNENEVNMATNLISSLSENFDPEKYSNEYRGALMEVIQAKIAGEEISVPEAPTTGKVIDLMDALKASIQMAKKEKGMLQQEQPPAPTTKGKKKAKTPVDQPVGERVVQEKVEAKTQAKGKRKSS